MDNIFRHASYILCMFILLFSAVNAHGDLFVRSASYISSKNRVMAVCLHVKPRSPSSVAIVRHKETGFIVIIAIDMHGNSSLRKA